MPEIPHNMISDDVRQSMNAAARNGMLPHAASNNARAPLTTQQVVS
jgi:hypothetical protein